MSKYRRILALVAFNIDSAAVAQRAVQLSRFYGATLALAAVVDSTAGFASDHVHLPAADDRRQTSMRGKLDRMMTEIGYGGGCEIIVGCGSEQKVVSELTFSWRPDLVLVGSRARHGLEQNGERTPYDVLIVQDSRPGFAGRMINALAVAL